MTEESLQRCDICGLEWRGTPKCPYCAFLAAAGEKDRDLRSGAEAEDRRLTARRRTATRRAEREARRQAREEKKRQEAADRRVPWEDRRVAMQEMYEELGMTLQQIGNRYGVSRERVRQIIDTASRQTADTKRREIDHRLDGGLYAHERKLWRSAERFWSHVLKTDTCWLWMGAKMGPSTHRYGHTGISMLRTYDRTGYAHRMSYALVHGPVPHDLHVLHTCDTPACVNPDHLWLGTQADNVHDRDRKGRGRWPGATNPHCIYPPSIIRMARTLFAKGRRIADISREIGLPYQHCWSVVHETVRARRVEDFPAKDEIPI